MTKLLVFTDLDGTLLDHESYAYEAALPALQRLKALKVPLILNSSKTDAEIAAWRRDLGNHHPYVVENGSAVCVPDGYFPHLSSAEENPPEGLFRDLGRRKETFIRFLGVPRRHLLHCLEGLRWRCGYRFRGFSDFSPGELAVETGLSLAEAVRAMERSGSEPIQWLDTAPALRQFESDLRRAGLVLAEGGRFFHVMGDTDKAVAMGWLIDQYRIASPGETFTCVALGDSGNDREMLESADIAVAVPPAEGTPLCLDRDGATLRPKETGAKGWCEAMDLILNQLT